MMKQCEHLEEIGKYDHYHWLPDGTEVGYLCEQCAIEQGFCLGCGYFIGGIEAEMYYIQKYGVCSNCCHEIDADSGEY